MEYQNNGHYDNARMPFELAPIYKLMRDYLSPKPPSNYTSLRDHLNSRLTQGYKSIRDYPNLPLIPHSPFNSQSFGNFIFHYDYSVFNLVDIIFLLVLSIILKLGLHFY